MAALGFTLAVPLGPVNIEIMKSVLNKSLPEKYNWLGAVLTGVGAMTADFVIAFSALTIGGEVLRNFFSNPFIRLALFTFNVLILGYLGFSALLSPPLDHALQDEANSMQIRSFGLRLSQQYLTGLSMVVTSPLTYLWWISIGTLILFSDLGSTPDLSVRLVVVIMFLSGILVWILLFTTLLSLVGRLPNPKLFLWITRGTALILLYFASLMIGEAWNALLEITTII